MASILFGTGPGREDENLFRRIRRLIREGHTDALEKAKAHAEALLEEEEEEEAEAVGEAEEFFEYLGFPVPESEEEWEHALLVFEADPCVCLDIIDLADAARAWFPHGALNARLRSLSTPTADTLQPTTTTRKAVRKVQKNTRRMEALRKVMREYPHHVPRAWFRKIKIRDEDGYMLLDLLRNRGEYDG